jgi:DNA-binding transcriptional LysR family regulator
MPDLRDMQLLAALAQHAHFARAADACGISQPAFSARIRNLEVELGVPLVKRGNRFMGFTAEGEIALRWARRLLVDADGLRQEVEEARGKLRGRIAVGVVPTALAFLARVPEILRANHPGLTTQIYSLTSTQINHGLEDFSLDVGVTYLDVDRPAALDARPLYDERYVLLSPAHLAPRRSGAVTWAEAIEMPLSLLTRNMRNRRLLDGVFEAHAGRAPTPVLETNDFAAALAQVARGTMATIAPELLADIFPLRGDVVCLPLAGPEVTTPIGLFVADREPLPPSILAFLAAVGDGRHRT